MFYIFARDQDEATARAVIGDLRAAGVEPRDDIDEALWQDAGNLKAVHRRVSLADCFCLALARREGAEVLTSDRHELGTIAPLGIVPIRFIR